MKLLVGLGNPGPKYETTRHNAGFLMLDLIADLAGISWSNSKFDGFMGKGKLLSEPVALLKPQTFMNLSGRSVAKAARFFKVPVEDMVVFHDDIDMEFGKVKTKVGGGHGGHNGIRSMISELGDQGFHRMKLGVGRPGKDERIGVTDWVLHPFTDAQLLGLQKEMFDAVMLRLKGIFGT